MTAQEMEKLIMNGEKVSMASEPLAQYLGGLKEKPKLFPPNTGCWRGYVGTWEFKNDYLYLIGWEGYAKDFNKRAYCKVGMDYIFPNQKEVLADWFSGEIRIPSGQMLHYEHAGYNSIYEIDCFIMIEKGKAISWRKVDTRLEEAKRLINEGKKTIPDKGKIIDKKEESIFSKIMDLLKKKK